MLTSLCQQKVENTIPTYVHGTVMPEMSDLIYLNSELDRIGILFKFQGSFEAGSKGCVSIVGIALGNKLFSGRKKLYEQRS